MSKVIITGGTGLIGHAIIKKLIAKGYEVVVLTRNPSQKFPPGLSNVILAKWIPSSGMIDHAVFEKADYVIHLAGAGVADKKWTAKRKKEIRDSRVQSSGLIVETLRKYSNNVKAVISASAIGWYGDADHTHLHGSRSGPFIETDPPANDFLGATCKAWEESILPVTEIGKRLVMLRIGIVLSPDGGALKEFINPLRFGMAAILGTGRQIISWIDIDDLANMYIAALEDENMQGVYNAVAPEPVSNKELVIQLARSRKRFYIPFKVPAFILKILFGEMSIEILKSADVSSRKIEEAGFKFKYPTIQDSLNKIAGKG